MLSAFTGMHLMHGRLLFWLVFLTGGVAYAGCTERDDVARPLEGAAGKRAAAGTNNGAGTPAAAGSVAMAQGGSDGGNDGVGGSGASVATAGNAGDGDGTAGEAGAGGDSGTTINPNACKELSFAERVTYDIEAGFAYVRGIATGDFNGDDKPDIVITNGGTASLFFNAGDGTFGTPSSIPSGSGSIDVIAFDANGDQKLDLAFMNFSFGVSVSLNQGMGVFAAPVAYKADDPMASVVAGDVTGDGKPDLVACLHQRAGLGVLVNQGDGKFADFVIYPPGPPQQQDGTLGLTLALADFDGKNGLDVVTGPGKVQMNNGDGSFGAVGKLQSVGQFAATADFNGDGWMDIASPTVSLGLGNGSFLPPQKALGFYAPGRIVAADVRGRGRPDIVGPGFVVPNNGDGTFGAGQELPFERDLERGPAAATADFNGDGKLDLAFISNLDVKGMSIFINTCTP